MSKRYLIAQAISTWFNSINTYPICVSVYMSVRILMLYTRHKQNTLYANFCRGRHTQQGLSFFHRRGWSWFFYVYTFLIFIARGGVVDGVCVCVLCVVCCAPTTEGGKNCHSLRAERTYILLACRCLCATTNFIIILSGLFFHSFFVFFCFCMLHFSLLFLLDFHAIPYTIPYTTGQL